MKSLLLPLTALFASIVILSCESSTTEESTSGGSQEETVDRDSLGLADEMDLEAMYHLDLKEDGLDGLQFFVHISNNTETGAKGKPQVQHEMGEYLWKIQSGPEFSFELLDYLEGSEEVMAEVKSFLEREGKIFHYDYLVDEPQMIVLRRGLKNTGEGIDHGTYHVYAVHDMGERRILFRTPLDGFGRLPLVKHLMHAYRTIGMDELPETYIPGA